MATLSIRFPNSVHEAVKDVAEKDDISINQFVTSAVIEKLTAIETESIIESRAKRASKERFYEILKKVPDSEPMVKEDVIK